MKRRKLLTKVLAACFVPPGAAGGAELTTQLKKIAELDAVGPALGAVLELNPDAASSAAALAGKPPLSPLHGCGILLKDNLDTADAMQTTAGSLALLGSRPAVDAEVVRKLRLGGLVILGKTNLSEWANIRSHRSTSGWSARGGLTRHPYRLPFNPSGSSSGSAVAVAAGYTRLAIGTETSGSIISPASACGIVGLKPTLGLVSQRGIIPISHHQDTAGPMTRTVREAALLLQVMAEQAHPLSCEWPADFLKGKRLGVLREQAGEHPAVLAHFAKALEVLRELGAEIIDPVAVPHTAAASQAAWAALLTELRADLNVYLAQRRGPVLSLAEVIAFNEKHRDRELLYFGQETFLEAEKLGTPTALSAAVASRALARRLAGPEGIDAALQSHRLDALVCPTNDPATRSNLKGEKQPPGPRYAGHSCAATPAIAGYPHLTQPLGLVDGLPVGLSWIGTAWSDAELLGMAATFERAHPGFREPEFLVD